MDDKPSPRSKEKKTTKKKSNTSWVVIAFSLSFCITAILSAVSDKVVSVMHVLIAAIAFSPKMQAFSGQKGICPWKIWDFYCICFKFDICL